MLILELESCLPHKRHVYKNENAEICVKIEKSALGASVESTIKYFSSRKHGRSDFQVLTANHASDLKETIVSLPKHQVEWMRLST